MAIRCRPDRSGPTCRSTRSRGRPVAVLGLARSGIALARFLSDRGARVTVYDARPAAELAERDRRARAVGRCGCSLGPDVDPARGARGPGAGRHLAVDQQPLSRRPSRGCVRRWPALEAAGRVPVVSEVDLFLRLCPALDHRRHRHQGQDHDQLAHRGGPGAGGRAVAAGRQHRHAARGAAARADAAPPGRARAVRAAAADAVARHGRGGLHPRDLATTWTATARWRRTAPSSGDWRSCAPPMGGWCSTTRIRSAAATRRPVPAAVVRYRRGEPAAGGVGVDDGWIVADGVERAAAVGGGIAATGPGGRIMPLGEIRLPGAHNISNVLAAVAVGLLLRHRARRHPARPWPASAASSTGWSRSALVDGVRFVNDSQGTQPDAVIAALRSFAPPIVLIAGGRDKNVAIDELARGRRGARGRGRADRRERPEMRRRSRRRPGAHRAAPTSWRRPSAAPTRSRASSRPPLRPTAAGDGAAQPGRRELRHVRRLRGAGSAFKEAVRGRAGRSGRRGAMTARPEGPSVATHAAPDAPMRLGRHAGSAAAEACTRQVARAAARAPRAGLPAPPVVVGAGRRRHADGLLQLGHAGSRCSTSDPFAVVGPQAIWALLGAGGDDLSCASTTATCA